METFKRLLQRYKQAVIAHAYTHDPKTKDVDVEKAWTEMENAEKALIVYVQGMWDDLLKC